MRTTAWCKGIYYSVLSYTATISTPLRCIQSTHHQNNQSTIVVILMFCFFSLCLVITHSLPLHQPFSRLLQFIGSVLLYHVMWRMQSYSVSQLCAAAGTLKGCMVWCGLDQNNTSASCSKWCETFTKYTSIPRFIYPFFFLSFFFYMQCFSHT